MLSLHCSVGDDVFKYGEYVIEVVGIRCRSFQSVEEINSLLLNIEKISIDRSLTIQLLDANYIAGRKHALFSALFALDALRHGRRHAEKLSMEILIYASIDKQISTAIKTVGVKVGTSEIIAVLIGRDEESINSTLSQVTLMLNGFQDDKILETNEGKIKKLLGIYNISLKEYEIVKSVSKDPEEALVKILINKMALLPYT
jgi:tRNA threonylcarbamoyladenosine modification (KEOPS) complex Cgi121 subunit